MKKKNANKYYKNLNIIRFFSCVAILLYHLNILPGGYLAVCTFFVLSGYLSCVSAAKNNKFSLKDYYLNKLLKIYLPLLIVVLLTVGIVSLIPSISWLNLKPETTSVILGYNNFWQLSVNLDYFARHVSSPFMHFWYIGILLQFELIFPFIYKALRKLGDKYKKVCPIIATNVLSIGSFIYFCFLALNNNIMDAYYNTFARVYSLLIGVSLGFIHIYYGEKITKNLKKKSNNKLNFGIYLLVLILLCIFVDSNSKLYILGMLAATLISCRLIDYAVLDTTKEKNIFEKVIKSVSSVSFEVYLVQYPIIFICQEMGLNTFLSLVLVIIFTFAISYLLHYILNFKNSNKKLIVLRVTLLVFALFGGYKYISSKNYTNEMKLLERQLEENAKLLEKSQEEYQKKLEEEQQAWNSVLNSLEVDEEKIKKEVYNLPIVGIGDSVMLGAADELKKQFKNGYIDAAISRTAWKLGDIIDELNAKKMLGDPIVINMGANGDCNKACKEKIMQKIGNKKVLWLTNTNKKTAYVNDNLKELAKDYDNLTIVDWNELSKDHSEYFVADGIHLTDSGKKAYTKAVYDAICDVYLKEYREKLEETIKDHENEMKKKVTFWGNDTILNVFSSINDDFKDAKYVINKSKNFEELKKEFQEYVEENKLNNRIVFALDSYLYLTESEYRELIKMGDGHEIYILFTKKSNYNNSLNEINNVTVINFYEQIKENPDYLMDNGVHLTKNGNKKLSEVLKDLLK